MITLGQQSNHGLAVIEGTKTTDYVHRKANEFKRHLKAKYKPGDACAKIQMEAKMDKVQFKNTLDYHNDIVAIRGRYNIQVDK